MSRTRIVPVGGLYLKIIVAADFHGNLDSARALSNYGASVADRGSVDALVICGDLSEFGSIDKGLAIISEIRKGFENVFFVTGNHDPPSLTKQGDFSSKGKPLGSNVTCLHGKVVKFQDMTLIGLSGFFPPFYGKWDTEGGPITRDDEAFRYLDRLFTRVADERENEQAKTILVTHDPPYGVADLSVLTRTNAGSRGIRETVLKWKPAAALCGHIHEGRGIARLGETLVVNPGSIHFRLAAYVQIEHKKEVKAGLIKI